MGCIGRRGVWNFGGGGNRPPPFSVSQEAGPWAKARGRGVFGRLLIVLIFFMGSTVGAILVLHAIYLLYFRVCNCRGPPRRWLWWSLQHNNTPQRGPQSPADCIQGETIVYHQSFKLETIDYRIFHLVCSRISPVYRLRLTIRNGT